MSVVVADTSPVANGAGGTSDRDPMVQIKGRLALRRTGGWGRRGNRLVTFCGKRLKAVRSAGNHSAKKAMVHRSGRLLDLVHQWKVHVEELSHDFGSAQEEGSPWPSSGVR